MDKEREQPSETPPDGRGKRPRDPNQLAKWVVEQSTSQPNESSQNDSQSDSNHDRQKL